MLNRMPDRSVLVLTLQRTWDSGYPTLILHTIFAGVGVELGPQSSSTNLLLRQACSRKEISELDQRRARSVLSRLSANLRRSQIS